MKRVLRIASAIAAFALVAVSVHPAAARRASAHSGSAPFPSQASCLGFDTASGSVGVTLLSSSGCTSSILPYFWLIPAQLDTSGTKTVTVTGKQTAANQLSCGLYEHNGSGAVLQTINFDPFATNGTYSARTKNITIASGNTLSVACGFNQSVAGVHNARILQISY